jgi:hypothetical protein
MKVPRAKADEVEVLIRKDNKGLSQPSLDRLVKTDPKVINHVIQSLAQFNNRSQIIITLHNDFNISYDNARFCVDAVIDTVSVVSPDFAANLLTSLMLSYQSLIKDLDEEIAKCPKRARADKMKMIRLKNDVLKAQIDHNTEDEGSTIGSKLIELYGLTPAIDITAK